MILVLEDRNGSLLLIYTKQVPVALYLTLQWRFNASESRENGFYSFLLKTQYGDLHVRQKILEKMHF